MGPEAGRAPAWQATTASSAPSPVRAPRSFGPPCSRPVRLSRCSLLRFWRWPPRWWGLLGGTKLPGSASKVLPTAGFAEPLWRARLSSLRWALFTAARPETSARAMASS